jgi:ABC-2 type transport system permease protein
VPTISAPAIARRGPASALTWRAFRDARTRTLAFAYLFALYAYIQPVGFASAYPTLSDRLAFAHSFANNDAIRLFYGYPYAPATIAGYSAWRVGGTLAIAAAAFGVLAAARALRAEEDSGRLEMVLAGAVRRRTVFATAILAIAASLSAIWFAETAGFVLGGLAVPGSAYLALATVSVAAVFAALGALVCQLAPTRRVALELGMAIVALALLLRVVADTSSGVAWLRWATPLGWAEELRPFTSPQPLVLLLPGAATVLTLALAARIAGVRDTGTAILPARDSAAPRLRSLSSASAQALRGERGGLISWVTGTAAFALVLGLVSKSVSSAGIPHAVQKEVAKLGSGAIATPSGYLSFVFIFFILAVSLFACGQVGAARQEESGERLETLLAQPLSRQRWLGGRLLLACAGAFALAATAGLATWVGAASEGVTISLGHALEAGANCLPVALLFLGVAALAYAVAPRASAGVAYGLVTLAFVWYLVGALVGVPHWLVELTPFAHVGFVPTEQFRSAAALVMLAIGLSTALLALAVFRRRDLAGA